MIRIILLLCLRFSLLSFPCYRSATLSLQSTSRISNWFVENTNNVIYCWNQWEQIVFFRMIRNIWNERLIPHKIVCKLFSVPDFDFNNIITLLLFSTILNHTCIINNSYDIHIHKHLTKMAINQLFVVEISHTTSRPSFGGGTLWANYFWIYLCIDFCIVQSAYVVTNQYEDIPYTVIHSIPVESTNVIQFHRYPFKDMFRSHWRSRATEPRAWKTRTNRSGRKSTIW